MVIDYRTLASPNGAAGQELNDLNYGYQRILLQYTQIGPGELLILSDLICGLTKMPGLVDGFLLVQPGCLARL